MKPSLCVNCLLIMAVKRKYNLRFGRKNLPAFILEKDNVVRIIVFTTIYSLVFINIFRPFNSETWIPGITRFNYFLYSSLMVLIGMFLISLSRVIMNFFTKKFQIGYLEYAIWIFAEVVLISAIYVFIAYKVGFTDNYISDYNAPITFWEAMFNIYRKAIANTIWMLLIPYVISFLYLSNENLVKMLKDQPSKEQNIIHFKDEKGDIRFSVTSDNVLYAESADNYVIIRYLNNGKVSDFFLRNNLKKLAEEMSDTPLQRCHRSFMINVEHVSTIKKDNADYIVEFDTNNIKNITISKTYQESIMEAFMKFSHQKKQQIIPR